MMKPTMRHTHEIEWPNGKGYTLCTPEYADAIADECNLMARLRDMQREIEAGHSPQGYADLYERAHRAADRVLFLQAAGHLGQGRRY